MKTADKGIAGEKVTGKELKGKYYACIIAAGSMWGCIGIFIRHLGGYGFSSLALTALRAMGAALILTIYMLAKHREKLRIKLRDSWCFAGTGILSLTFFNICYFTTIRRTSLAVASVLLYTAPMFVMLLSLFLFHETMTWRKGAALLMAFAGCVLVTGIGRGDMSLSLSAVLTGLGAGLGYGLYSIFGIYGLRRYDSMTVTVYTFLFATIGTAWFVDYGLLVEVVAAHPLVAVELLAFGFFTNVLPYLLYTKGLSGMEAGKASITASVEPVVASLVGIFCFGESVRISVIAGVLMVLGALVVLNVKSEKVEI